MNSIVYYTALQDLDLVLEPRPTDPALEPCWLIGHTRRLELAPQSDAIQARLEQQRAELIERGLASRQKPSTL